MPVIDVASVSDEIADDADALATFAISCDFTRWRRLQFTNSHTRHLSLDTVLPRRANGAARPERACVLVNTPNVEFDQIHVFDCLAGLRFGREVVNASIHDSIFSNIGWRVRHASTAAHAISWTIDAINEKRPPARRVVHRNVFHNFGNCGVQFRAPNKKVSAGQLTVEDNVFVNEDVHGIGILIESKTATLQQIEIRRNADWRTNRSLIMVQDRHAAVHSPNLAITLNRFEHEIEAGDSIDRRLWRNNARRFGELDVLLTDSRSQQIFVGFKPPQADGVTVTNGLGKDVTIDLVGAEHGELKRVEVTSAGSTHVACPNNVTIVVVRSHENVLPPVAPRVGGDPGATHASSGDCDVVLSGDRSQFVPMFAVINSLLRNSLRLRARIHVLLTEASGDAAQFARESECLFRPEWRERINVVPFDTADERLFRFGIGDTQKNSGERNLSSPHNFVRFYLPTLLPQQMRKVIWLDADVVVRADICQLFDAALLTDRYEVAAAVRYRSYIGDDREKFDLSETSPLLQRVPQLARCRNEHCFHFNAGVMVYRLDLWRAHNTTARLEDWVSFLARYPEAALGLTQPPLILNYWENAEEVDVRWNMARAARIGRRLGDTTMDTALDSAFLWHFNGNLKPWRVSASQTNMTLHNLWAQAAIGYNCTEEQRTDCSCLRRPPPRRVEEESFGVGGENANRNIASDNSNSGSSARLGWILVWIGSATMLLWQFGVGAERLKR